MIAAASAFLLAATLTACGQSAKPENEQTAEQAASPDAKPGISISEARLVLPAVAGNPGAAYFNLTNGGDKPAELAGAYVEGSQSAEIHETMGGTMDLAAGTSLAPGETVKFEPGGKHVMVFGIADSVKAGSVTEMTLTFADGDKLSTPLKVETVTGGTGEGKAH
jgi:copper(I)-binding protein